MDIPSNSTGSGRRSMRESGSHDAQLAGVASDNQKRGSVSRLPPLAVPPTPQTMLQQDSTSMFSTPQLAPGNVSMRGVEDHWGTRSSRTLSTGSGVVRRRMTAGTGLEPLPLQPMRRPSGIGGMTNSASMGAVGGTANGTGLSQALSGLSPATSVSQKGVTSLGRRISSPLSASTSGLAMPAPSSVFKLNRSPLFPAAQLQMPSQLENEVPAAHGAKRPPYSEGQFGSRPHGMPLRHEAQAASAAALGVRSSTSPRQEQRRSAAAIDGEALNIDTTPPAERGQAVAGSDMKIDSKDNDVAASPVTESLTSGPKYAAKCAAVANLQRLFFEEVGKSGDANAAAASALLRLAEESRPSDGMMCP